MISLLLHESKAKLRMSVNNKDIIRMYLSYNWLITQKTLPNNAFFVNSKQMNGFRLCSPIKASLWYYQYFL